MTFRKDKDVQKFIGISLSIFLIGLLIFHYIQSIFVLIFIMGGLLGILIGLNAARKPRRELIEDERSERITEKAGFHAFWAILYIAAIIILLRMLKLSPSLTPSYDLSEGARQLWLIGVLVFLILRWYYNKRGEA